MWVQIAYRCRDNPSLGWSHCGEIDVIPRDWEGRAAFNPFQPHEHLVIEEVSDVRKVRYDQYYGEEVVSQDVYVSWQNNDFWDMLAGHLD